MEDDPELESNPGRASEPSPPPPLPASPTQSPSLMSSSSEELAIKLGDFIQIIAPTNQEIHNRVFLVDYLSPRKMKLVDIDSLAVTMLKIDATGNLSDESITSIQLMSRPEQRGYARQNNLVVSTWVDIRFGGDIPAIITGMITNLEEDMIEIRTYPEDEMIYINFAYMGIPENLPIEEIKIRAPPSSFGRTTEAVVGPEGAAEAGAEPEGGFLTMGMDAVTPPESLKMSPLEQRRHERQLARTAAGGEDATEQPVGESEHTVLGAAATATAAAPGALREEIANHPPRR